MRLEQVAHRVREERLDREDHQDHLVHRVQLVKLVKLDLQAHVDLQDPKVH